MFVVVGGANCSYCKNAIALLASKGQEFHYFDLAEDEACKELFREDELKTIPQVWSKPDMTPDCHIGGYDDLLQYYKELNKVKD